MNHPFSLTQAYNEAGVPLAARDRVASLAAARRVAYSLPLPNAPLGSPVDYYNSNYAAQAEEAVCALNEAAVMDIDFALASARLYWLARYKVLFEPESSEAMQAVTGLVQSLLAQQPVPDLGLVQDPHGGGGTAVAVVDGHSTLVGLSQGVEAMQQAFHSLWGDVSKGG